MEQKEPVSRRTVKRARTDAREEQEAEARGQRLAEIERVKAEAKQEVQAELEQVKAANADAKAEVLKLKAENAYVNSENARLGAENDLLRLRFLGGSLSVRNDGN